MRQRLKIGTAHVDFSDSTIDGPNGRASMEPKVMKLLRVLSGQPGVVLSRETLLDDVWGVDYGGDESLSRAISLLRKAFGEERGKHQYIETIPKRGYRLIADVEIVEQNREALSENSRAPRALASLYRHINARTAGLFVGFTVLALVGLLFFWTQPSAVRFTDDDTGLAFLNTPQDAINQKSIAVLPFADLSGTGDQQYLADGLAEEILNAIIKFPDIRVIGQTSSFMFRERQANLNEIGSTLKVRYVLTGSLRKQRDQVRISAQLVQTDDGHVLWSKTYDESTNDIFDLQENIAQAIARNLDLALDASTEGPLVAELTDDQEAYDLFLQGRELSRRFGHQSKVNAVGLLERATQTDPQFAAAWAWLGRTKMLLSISSKGSETNQLVAGARSSVDRALMLDPNLAMGHYTKSMLQDYDLDFAGSLDSIETASALDPNQPFLVIRRGYYHALIGDIAKAERLMKDGLRRDPTDAVGLLNLAIVKLSVGDVDAAAKLLTRSNDLGFMPARGWLCLIAPLQNGMNSADKCWKDLPDNLKGRYAPVFEGEDAWRTLSNAQFGDDVAARKKVIEWLDVHFKQPDARANAYLLGIYLGLGEPKRFMDIFVAHPFPINAPTIASIWMDQKSYRNLRQHHEFPAFAERIGLVRAWQKYGWPDQCKKAAGTDGSNGRFTCR